MATVWAIALAIGARPSIALSEEERSRTTSPEQIIIEYLEHDGVVVSEEVARIIREDPVVLQQFREISEHPDPMAAESEAAERLNQFLQDHVNDLSPEDLERLLHLTSGRSQTQLLGSTRENLERLLECARLPGAYCTFSERSTGEAAGPVTGIQPPAEPEAQVHPPEPESEGTEETAEAQPPVEIPETIRRRIEQAPEPVREFIQRLSARRAGVTGVPISETLVERIIAEVEVGMLEIEDVRTILDTVQLVGSTNEEQVISSVREAVSQYIFETAVSELSQAIIIAHSPGSIIPQRIARLRNMGLLPQPGNHKFIPDLPPPVIGQHFHTSFVINTGRGILYGSVTVITMSITDPDHFTVQIRGQLYNEEGQPYNEAFEYLGGERSVVRHAPSVESTL